MFWRDLKYFGGRDLKYFGGRDLKNLGGRDLKYFGGRDLKYFGGSAEGPLVISHKSCHTKSVSCPIHIWMSQFPFQ